MSFQFFPHFNVNTSVIFAGLGQVLEFMYTAKLTLTPQNVEDVLAVATFLQMQEIVNACSAYKSLAGPLTSNNGQCCAMFSVAVMVFIKGTEYVVIL